MRKFLTIVFLLASSHLFAQTSDIYEKAADGYLADKNYQAAIDNYNEAIKKGKYDNAKLAVIYNELGESYYGLNKPEAAIKNYDKAIELKPGYSDAYWGRGVVYDDNNKNELAIADYKKTIELIKSGSGDGNLAQLNCNIANKYYELKDYDHALQADSVSIFIDQKYSRAFKVMGNIHAAQDKLTFAVADYSQALTTYTGDDKEEVSELFADRADAERDLEKYKSAINDYTQAINFNNKNGSTYWNRASAYHYNSDYKLAADDYTTAMGFYQDDKESLSKLYEDRAEDEHGQSLLSAAIKDDSIAISLDSKNTDAYYDRASSYVQNGDYRAGINDYNKLLPFYKGKDKAMSFIYYQIADAEYFLNEFDKVVSDCTTSIKLNPEYSEVYFDRGKVYLKKMNNKQLATNDFNKVMSLDTTKKSVGYIFSLFYIGRGDEAVSILQNRILNTTDDAVLLGDYYNMACLYSLMNKPDEANIYLKKAIDNGYAKKYAIADEDLNNIRNTDDYKSIMAGAAQ